MTTGKLSLAASGTPLEKEYRGVCDAMARFPRADVRFDPRPYDPRALVTAQHAWRARMEAEHRSFPIFAGLATQLSEAGATIDVTAVMLRMAQDELRHTETCGRVVQALGGEATCTVERAVAPLATHRGTSPEERCLRNVIYTTCLSEMAAVARMVDALDATTDPFVREATRELLADEVLHGQFGFHYLEAWGPWLAARPAVVASLERYLRHALAVLEEELAGSAPEGAPALTDDERALGVGDAARAREVFYGTVEGAVLPGLERLGLAATAAWRARARERR